MIRVGCVPIWLENLPPFRAIDEGVTWLGILAPVRTMSEPERLRERIVDTLERDRHTHKSLRQTLTAEYGYSETAVSRALSTLTDEGVIVHEDGFFELADSDE